MTQPKPWKLLSSTDASPSPWYPIERRTYQLPSGKVLDDFTVSTLADVAMIVPVTADERIVFVRQFKPGYGEVILEFPAGRIEASHADLADTARHELEEETGIKAESMEYFGVFSGFVTKATERVHCFLAHTVEFNSKQRLDENEEIEVVLFQFAEVEKMLANNQINAAVTVAAWDLARRSFGHRFTSWQ